MNVIMKGRLPSRIIPGAPVCSTVHGVNASVALEYTPIAGFTNIGPPIREKKSSRSFRSGKISVASRQAAPYDRLELSNRH
jgi:hypothetical protein